MAKVLSLFMRKIRCWILLNKTSQSSDFVVHCIVLTDCNIFEAVYT